MDTVRVGMREFRDKMATYVLEAKAPVAITRHGDTIGFFIPARKQRTEAEKLALEEAGERMQAIMSDLGITEDEIIEDFKQFRAAAKRR